MIKVYVGGILMVAGMLAIISQPVAGIAMLGGGYWLFQQSTASQRHGAQSQRTGFALLCMIITGLAALFGFA